MDGNNKEDKNMTHSNLKAKIETAKTNTDLTELSWEVCRENQRGNITLDQMLSLNKVIDLARK